MVEIVAPHGEFISVCVPVSIRHESQIQYFIELMDSLINQNYDLKEILVSDDQGTKEIEYICAKLRDSGINIQYTISNYTGIANNLNHCISMAKGDLIKIMFQDDFFITGNALSHIQETMSRAESSWYVSACNHYSQEKAIYFEDFFPKKSNRLLDGANSISSPSVVTFKSDQFLPFSDKLTYLIDCEWYLRMTHNFGLPIFDRELLISNRIHSDQATHWAKFKKDDEVVLSKLMHTNPKMDARVCLCLC